MFAKHSLAVALATLGLMGSHGSMATGDLEARIAELERQLAALKAEVARSSEDTQSALQTVAVQAREIEAARPAKTGTRFQYGGYVQLDAITTRYSDGKPDSLLDDIFVPSLIPVAPASGGSDAFRSTNVHAKTSRFYFATDTQTDAGRLSSFIELDFVLSGQGDERVSNSFSSRIRHAYLEWEYGENSSLLAGQAWSTFLNVDALPDLIDLVGPVGTAFERQPLIRWTRGPLQLALENEVTRVSLPEGGNRLDDSETIPDFVARYNGDIGDLSWSVAGITRQLSYERRADAGTVIASDDTFGYGVSLAGKWQLGRDDLRFMVNYGDALGRYMGLNAFEDGYIDVNGDIGKIEQIGGVIAYRHYWSEHWRSNVSLSLSQADNPSLREFAAAGDLARAYRSLHVNLNYLPAPNLQLGTELLLGQKELEDGRDGELLRLQFAAKYAF